MTEAWRPVVGWEGLYEVSDAGRVRSLDRIVDYPDRRRSYLKPGRVLRPSTGSAGYPTVILCGSGRHQHGRIHVMVLEAFVGPRPAGCEVRHLNGVRNDNRLANLAWGTPTENTMDRVLHGRASRGLTLDDVAFVRVAADKGITDTEIARRIGVTRRSVALVRTGRTWGHMVIDPERHAAALALLAQVRGGTP